MSVFPDANDLTIHGGQFNAVQGNQITTYNYYFTNGGEATVIHGTSTGNIVGAASPQRPPHPSPLRDQEVPIHVNPSLGSSQDGEWGDLRSTNERHTRLSPYPPSSGPVNNLESFSDHQITVILEPKNPISSEESGELIQTSRIAWQVYDMPQIGAVFQIPLPRSVGFGTVAFSDDGEIVTSPQFSIGKPDSTLFLRYNYGTSWSTSQHQMMEPESDCIRAGNLTGFPTRFAIGTYSENGGRSAPGLNLLAVTTDINQGDVVRLDLVFRLSLYMTKGVGEGQIMGERDLRQSRILFRLPELELGTRRDIKLRPCLEDAQLRMQEL